MWIYSQKNEVACCYNFSVGQIGLSYRKHLCCMEYYIEMCMYLQTDYLTHTLLALALYGSLWPPTVPLAQWDFWPIGKWKNGTMGLCNDRTLEQWNLRNMELWNHWTLGP